MKWQAVFFDFDGVILDSVNVKTEAFAQMFRKFGAEIETAVVKYHLNNGGITRSEKFKYYYENLLKKTISVKEIEELSDKFSELVIDKVVESDFVDGSYQTLLRLQEMKIPCYIVSATPHAEINIIAKRKKIDNFFKEIHGAPRKKWEIVSEVLEKEKFVAKECLFVGDAYTDYDAALRNGVQFLGIVSDVYLSPFPENVITSNRVVL